jgi:oligopeptide transport system substrate-binding protein
MTARRFPSLSLILLGNEEHSFNKKADVVFQTMESLSKRYSYSSFFLELNRKALRFLLDIPRDFFENHSARHLCRMIGTFAFFEKELNERAKITPASRHVLVRILKNLTSDDKEILGFLVVLKLSKEEEHFQASHFLKAIQHVIPGVKEIPDSLYMQWDRKNCLVFLYLEVRKIRGRDFSYQYLKYLRETLQKELKERVACLSPSLIIQPNDEEIYRDIIQLSRELKFLQDIPQAMISFQEQNGDFLKFTVIIVRVLKKQSFPLRALSAKLPSSLRVISEQVSKVGLLGKKYPKEATVLTIEVENTLFFRKNYSIDLRKARQYLVKAIELMIGEFRDYNGGFLSKQDEQLEYIKNTLDEKTKKHSSLLEKLFYSLMPSVFQAFLLPETSEAWTLLFVDALQQEPAPMQKYLLFKKENILFALTLVKTRYSEFKMVALEGLLKSCLYSSQAGYSYQEIEGFLYFSFIFQSSMTSQLENLLNQILPYFASDALIVVPREKKQILKINFQEGDPPSLSPHIGIDMRCYTLGKALFEGLTRLDPKGNPELAAAYKLTVSPCGTQYTFQLRPMKWSNGEEVTAFHFENAWKKAISPFSHCLRPDLFYLIKNVRKAHLGQVGLDAVGISSFGLKTLYIELEYPSPYFLELLVDPLFSPLYEVNEEPTVFNGPFVMRAWKRDQQLILDRNPYYWDADKIRLSGIEISMQKDPYAVLKMFEEGAIDWIGNPFSLLPLEKARDLKKNGSLEIKSILGIYCLHCNTNYLPLSSSKVRRALSYAINRQQLCVDVLLGQTPCYSPIPPELSLVKESEIFPEGNIQIAQMLLEEGLWDVGLSCHSLPPLTFLHAHIGGQKQLAQAIQNQWEKACDIQVQIAELEWNTLSSIFDRRQFQIGGCYRNFLYSDPMYCFNLLKESANYLNASAWQHPSFQEIIDLANRSTDPNVRNQYLRQAERILIEEMPIIPLYVDTFYYAIKDTLQGFHLSNLGNVDFKNAYFKEMINK